ncbi:hypothetical protein [Leucobacter komagatae]|uniref:Uncharacterized protein n=1 Tax=Leucobacter komagatae TaxID=55969 RepID=A0A0D0IQY7_9MICO|nr:hypothetical protein [Leucobacter komagatae]KIP51903.1 hypothetical protein SD72_12265 [Leucobacter komagatae]
MTEDETEARKRAAEGASEDVEVDDATVVVAQEDATVVVAAADRPGHTDEATIAAAQRPGAANGAHAKPGAVAGRRAPVGAPVAAPVEEPDEIPPELAKLLFKNPLDAKRRAPAAPFPVEQSSLPRGGVRGGIPVVYGARSEAFVERSVAGELGRSLGSPPVGYDVPVAVREALPSLARLNRRFSALAWAGAFVVPVVAGAGLWWVLTQLLRP